uniref:Actin-binding Rho-activating protein n=1 Tax=Leptobrachium leishanense TaxID=445787 RepID=A0A8C5MI73_9ANUR
MFSKSINRPVYLKPTIPSFSCYSCLKVRSQTCLLRSIKREPFQSYAMAPNGMKDDAKPAKRAIRKIKTATLVSSLTKGWQQWASEHSTKQAQEPSGWAPCTDGDVEVIPQKTVMKIKPLIVPEAGKEDPCASTTSDNQEAHIKTVSVTKSFSSKAQEKGMDIAALTDRYEKDPTSTKHNSYEAMVDKILQGSLSPTRRRKCSNIVSQLTKSWKHMEDGEEPVLCLESGQKIYDVVENRDLEIREKNDDEKPMEVERKEHVIENSEDAARIKRPASSLNKAAGELHNINKAYKRYSPVNNIKGKWEKWSDQHTLNQKLNPFSDEFDHEFAMSTRLQKGEEGYGRPKDGTKTAERAMRAEAHIHREMRDLCYIISTMAEPRKDGKTRVTFGELFDRYVRISDKVVGILLRARKHNMVDFPGEMLWQGRDDYVIITLL